MYCPSRRERNFQFEGTTEPLPQPASQHFRRTVEFPHARMVLLCDWFGLRFNAGRVYLALAIAVLLSPAVALAQTDEIQVVRRSNCRTPGALTSHGTITSLQMVRIQPAFPGGLIPDKSFNGVTEWAYGVTDWFEARTLPSASTASPKTAVRRSTEA